MKYLKDVKKSNTVTLPFVYKDCDDNQFKQAEITIDFNKLINARQSFYLNDCEHIKDEVIQSRLNNEERVYNKISETKADNFIVYLYDSVDPANNIHEPDCGCDYAKFNQNAVRKVECKLNPFAENAIIPFLQLISYDNYKDIEHLTKFVNENNLLVPSNIKANCNIQVPKSMTSDNTIFKDKNNHYLYQTSFWVNMIANYKPKNNGEAKLKNALIDCCYFDLSEPKNMKREIREVKHNFFGFYQYNDKQLPKDAKSVIKRFFSDEIKQEEIKKVKTNNKANANADFNALLNCLCTTCDIAHITTIQKALNKKDDGKLDAGSTGLKDLDACM
ncbi:MAG: hypothetical protein IJZ26_00120 [Clostridia bacterium]|nr:hypothetical protein [Clostridia bacterium]MBQ9785976.1 hypothetical protein [Clostridia bacterium]